MYVIKRLSQNYPVAIKATFLEHAFPLEYNNHQGYIDMLIDEIIPEIAKHELAQYIDVFLNQVTLLLPRQNKLWKRN
jgi:imidazolonepropionase